MHQRYRAPRSARAPKDEQQAGKSSEHEKASAEKERSAEEQAGKATKQKKGLAQTQKPGEEQAGKSAGRPPSPSGSATSSGVGESVDESVNEKHHQDCNRTLKKPQGPIFGTCLGGFGLVVLLLFFSGPLHLHTDATSRCYFLR